MSEGEQIHVSDTGGHKAGNDERYSLIPAKPLRELARHYGLGSQKYQDHNWRLGYSWHLSYDALCRHLQAFWDGEDYDPDPRYQGLSVPVKHITAVAWHAFALSEFMDRFPEFDDRYKRSE